MHLSVLSFYCCVCRNGPEVNFHRQFCISHSNNEGKKNASELGKCGYRYKEMGIENPRQENTWNYFYSAFVKMDYNSQREFSLKEQNIITSFSSLNKICDICHSIVWTREDFSERCAVTSEIKTGPDMLSLWGLNIWLSQLTLSYSWPLLALESPSPPEPPLQSCCLTSAPTPFSPDAVLWNWP